MGRSPSSRSKCIGRSISFPENTLGTRCCCHCPLGFTVSMHFLKSSFTLPNELSPIASDLSPEPSESHPASAAFRSALSRQLLPERALADAQQGLADARGHFQPRRPRRLVACATPSALQWASVWS